MRASIAQAILRGLRPIVVLLVASLLLLGCMSASPARTPAGGAEPASAAAAESPAPASTSAPPTPSPVQADVTAAQPPVEVSKANGAPEEVPLDGRVVLQAGDRVTVADGGHAVIQIADRVTVDVLQNSDLRLTGLRLEPGGAVFVTLTQGKGDTRVALTNGPSARVLLETSFGSVTALTEGTEFLVCHDPTASTCVVVAGGQVQVAGPNQVVTLDAGEATTMAKGADPGPPLCANLDAVNEWLDGLRANAGSDSLASLVAGWQQAPCGAQAAAATTAPAATAPPTVEPTATPQPLPSADGMVQIPGGDYVLGRSKPDAAHVEFLTQATTLASYWIDTYEVTNAQYQVFVDQTGHAPPTTWPGKPKNPVQGVTWDDAVAYCTWAHKRLPSEAEWEAAGRGPGANPPLYPWGDDPTAGGQVDELPRTGTYEVGAFAFNKSALGVYDMAGNVWEWVGDPYNFVPDDEKILRGGRFGLIEDMAFRQQTEPDNQRFVPYAGFRCAADAVQGG